MKIGFQLVNRLAGFAAETIGPNETGQVIVFESLTSLDGALLTCRLEALHSCLFGYIPNLQGPFAIDNLLIVIRHDLSATAYINELQPQALICPRGPITVGQKIFANDILEISSLDLGIPIPQDCGFVLVRSFGWRRSLLYDFGPLGIPPIIRAYDLEQVLAKQAFKLLTGKFNVESPLFPETVESPNQMNEGLDRLVALLDAHCEQEAQYQELLESNAWFLYGQYRQILRGHPKTFFKVMRAQAIWTRAAKIWADLS